MVSYYSLVSIFTEASGCAKIDVKFIDVSMYNITRKTKQLAIDYICNAVGKNNFVDTLSAEYRDLAVEKLPLGYVLKEGDLYKRGQIDVFLNTFNQGFLRSYTTSKLMVTFAIIAAEATSKAVEKDYKVVVDQIKERANQQRSERLDVSCINMDVEEEEPDDSAPQERLHARDDDTDSVSEDN